MKRFSRPATIGLLMLLCLTRLSNPLFAQEPDADTIIESIMATYGGREALQALHAYRLEASLQTHVHPQTAQVIRIWETPDHLKVFIRYPKRMELRILKGFQAWRGSTPHTLAEVSGILRDAMLLQLLRANIPDLLMRMQSHVRLLEYTDSEITLELPTGADLQFRLTVNPHTFRVVQTEGQLSAGDRDVVFQTRYADFREVNGLLFPFAEENYASGVHTASTRITHVLVNPQDTRLHLPGGDEAQGYPDMRTPFFTTLSIALTPSLLWSSWHLIPNM